MKKILVVEDEQMLAKIIGMKLEEEQYEVLHAYDGEEAYSILTQPDLPDLVLLDVLLPKMSGFDVLEKLHTENKPLPKVIVFSNFAQKADVERAHALGAIDYIVKAAFSPAEILTKIREIFATGGTSTPAPATPAAEAKPSEAPVKEAPVKEAPEPAKEDKVSAEEAEAPVAPAEKPQESSAYQSFDSLEEVMPMSEVLHPDEPTNNP